MCYEVYCEKAKVVKFLMVQHHGEGAAVLIIP